MTSQSSTAGKTSAKATSSGQSSGQKTGKSQRRRYNSPLRRRQTAETRQRIISAGADLIHEIPYWDWRNLTFKAVGERAGVSERTVYRHFSTERKLKDAVMQQLVNDSGIALDELEVKDFATAAAVVFRFFASMAASTPEETDPTFASIDQHRRQALLNAVARVAPEWSERQRENVAAMLDMLWNLPPYERLRRDWQFDTERAIEAVSWVIELIQEAISQDRRPG